MRSGLYERSFIFHSKKANISITFKRLLNMKHCHECIQQIIFEADKDVDLTLSMSLDCNVLHWNSDCYFKRNKEFAGKQKAYIAANTGTSSR